LGLGTKFLRQGGGVIELGRILHITLTMTKLLRTAGVACLLSQVVNGIQVTVANERSVKDAAGTIAFGLMKYYTGNNTGDVPGNLPDPYFCKCGFWLKT
jgi:hypothetical protein